jgi:hypothetical protein
VCDLSQCAARLLDTHLDFKELGKLMGQRNKFWCFIAQ